MSQLRPQLDMLPSVAFKDIIVYGFASWISYYIALGIYRVYFHPLAKFPGPKLAALTFWYEFYYELYPHRFQYGFKIKQLHEQYGPIVRINPIHLHIHDHDFVDAIYAAGSHRRDRCKWWHHVGSKTMAGSMLEAIDHDLHKSRRGAVSSFFSKKSVLALEPVICNSVEKLLQRIKDEKGDKIVNLNYAFAAMTLDIISAYCFGESMDTLSIPEYGKDWLDTMHNGIQSRPVGRQFPWLINTLLDIPPDFMAKISYDMAKINGFTHQMLPKIQQILGGDNEKRDVQRTIFHDMRDGSLSEEEKAPMRLMGESHILLGAGGETTARTLAVTTYYIMKKKDVREILRDELRTVMPQPDSAITLAQLEALPYLSAIINEGLRVAHGVSSRQPRIATHEDLIYKQWTIPRGTPVMQSAYLLHTDPNIFPDPLDFQPQRWLDNPGLKRHLFAFGRGSRSCLGMNLATSELFLAVALLWRRFDLEIYDTTEERDVLTTHDCFLGMTDLKSEGIKARILGVIEE